MVSSAQDVAALTAWLPQPALVCDGGGEVAVANDAARRLLDRDPAGEPLATVLPGPPGVQRWRAEVRRADGVPRLVEVSCSDPDDDGQRLLLLRELDPVAILTETQQGLDTAFEVAPIGMAFLDVDGHYVRVNRAMCDLLGRREADLLGRRDQQITHPDDRDADTAAAWRILRGEIDHWITEKRFVRPDGGVVWVIANLSFLRTEEGLPLMWLGQFQDITARKTLEGRLRREAGEDPLTGLPNRRHLLAELDRELGRVARRGGSGALLLVDLDGFKAVNDDLGHGAGDTVLRDVGAALYGRLRREDLVGRIGGDEFAVLLPVASPEQAAAVARSLEDAVRAVPVAGGRVRLDASIGVACFTEGTTTSPDELLAQADAAMYRAKLGRRRAP